MPQMFPMSMLVLSVVVMGILTLCLMRLFWSVIDTSTLVLPIETKDTPDNFSHTW